MDPVNKGFCFLTPLRFPDFFGYFPVSQEHEIFHEFVRFFIILNANAYRPALFIQVEFYLLRFKIDRSLAETLLPELCGKLVQHSDLFAEFSFAGFDYLLYLIIIKPPV